MSGPVRDIRRELREAARESRGTGRRQPWRTRPGGAGPVGASAVADLEHAVGELAAEVRRLARGAAVAEPDLVAATAVVTRALADLRRLLRG